MHKDVVSPEFLRVVGQVLDAVPLLACLVEKSGRVVCINRVWRQFAGLHPSHSPLYWTDLVIRGGPALSDPSGKPGFHGEEGDWPTSLLWHRCGLAAMRTITCRRMGQGEFEGWILNCPEEGEKPDSALKGTVFLQHNARQNRLSALLTDLQGPDLFTTELDRALYGARSCKTMVALMLVDIDHFRDLGEQYGTGNADSLLRLLVARLESIMPETAFLGRLARDVFGLVLTGMVTPQIVTHQARAVLRLTDVAFQVDGKALTISLSVGAALFPHHHEHAEGLYRCAQLALRDVKNHGRGGFRFYRPAMNRPEGGVALQTNCVRQMLRDALLFPVYQPRVRLADGALIGCEALLRWKTAFEDGDGARAYPEIFRSYDLATRVSAAMQDQVFRDMNAWKRDGLAVPLVSINVAPVEFMQDDFAERLLDRLGHHGIAPDMIELELTEHVLYENSAHYIHRALMLLHKAGIRIALDDFGTGYSALGFLRDFPVSSVKVDRSFVERICIDPAMEVIVDAIIRFGEAIPVDIVAEGIEHQEQCALLLKLGCVSGQGYLFSRAVPSDIFMTFLQPEFVFLYMAF